MIVDDGRLGLTAARGGVGLMYVADTMTRADLASGSLRTVLDDRPPLSGGYYIYYSGRRQAPAGLRLLIDLVRELRPLGF